MRECPILRSKHTMNPKQRQALKAIAHKLKPVILIGSKGLTPAVLKETDSALLTHELIKVRVASNDREERKEILAQMAQSLSAEVVQSIGNIGVLYRKNQEESNQ